MKPPRFGAGVFYRAPQADETLGIVSGDKLRVTGVLDTGTGWRYDIEVFDWMSGAWRPMQISESQFAVLLDLDAEGV